VRIPPLGEFHRCVNALFDGVAYEAAGVEDDNVCFIEIRDQFELRCLDCCHHAVGIDLVLGAAEGHERDARHPNT